MNKPLSNLGLAIQQIKKANSILALYVSGNASIEARTALFMAMEYIKTYDQAAADEAESQALGDCEGRPGQVVRE